MAGMCAGKRSSGYTVAVARGTSLGSIVPCRCHIVSGGRLAVTVTIYGAAGTGGGAGQCEVCRVGTAICAADDNVLLEVGVIAAGYVDSDVTGCCGAVAVCAAEFVESTCITTNMATVCNRGNLTLYAVVCGISTMTGAAGAVACQQGGAPAGC